MILSGYIYIARAIYRLPLAMFVAPLAGLELAKNHVNKFRGSEIEFRKHSSHKWFNALLFPFIGMYTLSAFTILFVIGMLTYILNFGVYSSIIRDKLNLSTQKAEHPLVGIGQAVDRAGLILISIAATLPTLEELVSILGLLGIFILLTAFLFKGTFTSLVLDS